MTRPSKPTRRTKLPAAAIPITTPTQPADDAELRRRAEERLKRQGPAGGGQTTAVETARLVHELQVHQIELEMQNEELQQARAHVETVLAQYTDLYDFAPVGYMTLDREGAIRQVNMTGARLFGVEHSRLVNRRLGLFVAECDRRTFSDFLQNVFAGQARECCEVTLPQDGSQALVLQIEGTRSADGQECRAVALDITERDRLQQTLREAKDRLEIRVKERTVELEQTNRTLQVEIVERKSAEEALNIERQRLYDVLETLPAYVVLLSADYHVPFANRFFRERFGESEGRRCYEYLFNRTAPCETCETYTVVKTAAPHHWEWIGPDGRNYDISDFPFTDTDGTPLILEMGIDITETKRAQAALTEANESLERRVDERTTELRLSEARLRDVVLSVADWVWEVDENGVYTYSSEKGYGLLGVSSGDVVGKTPFDFMPPDEAKRVGAIFSEIAARKAPIRDLENWNIRRNGERVCLLTNAVPILDEAGNLKGYRGVDKDITMQRQLETRFLQAQKMEVVGQLASGIAHDFNNLLTVINGTVDLVLAGLKEGVPLRTDLQDIRQAGERAASLTRQLLAFSRKQIMEFEVLDLSTLVADLRSMLQRLIGENIALVVVPARDVGCVMADSSQIEQVVMNLAVNARDAMLNGGTLTIETRDVELDEAYAEEHPSVQPGPHVMLAISDTGTGMDEATRRRIFEPFFTTKAPGTGTGLGLSTVHGIVKQSGGSIWVYSEPGMGTTFKMYLPRVEGVVRRIQPAPAVRSVHGTETILLVEDEEAVRRLAKRVLQSVGYTVLTASDGGEALLVLERHDGLVHLVLTDMVMPGMSGRELVAQIKDLSPLMKVLFTSGYTDEAILHHGLLDPAFHFIGKPYTVAQLTRQVREALES